MLLRKNTSSLESRFVRVLSDAISDIVPCDNSKINKEFLLLVVCELIGIVNDEITEFLGHDYSL